MRAHASSLFSAIAAANLAQVVALIHLVAAPRPTETRIGADTLEMVPAPRPVSSAVPTMLVAPRCLIPLVAPRPVEP